MEALAVFTFAAILVLSPLLIHELGHWAILRRLKVPVVETWIGLGPTILHFGKLRIGMLPIGAAVLPEQTKFDALHPKQKICVALAGPIASLLYGALLFTLIELLPQTSSGLSYELLKPVAFLNFFLFGINLLPIPPLDGFQAYRFWRQHIGCPLSPRAERIAGRLGNGLVYGIGFFAIGRYLM